MIKGINQSGRYISVAGGLPSTTYINPYSGALGVGNMRYNGVSSNIEVYDGTMWQTLQSSYATVQLDEEATLILDWAKSAMFEEIKIKELAKNHPAIAAAQENVKRAKEQLEITIMLSKDAETTN
jgi:hypothetical protein